MAKNFYISDTHFGHYNVIRFDNRPFSSCEEMEDTIVANWNGVVEKDDTVYILGDFCWLDESEWVRILDRLNGKKVLIKGNHDYKRLKQGSKIASKFLGVYDYLEVSDNGNKVILSHYPLPFYRSNYNPNMFHLYGHVHRTLEEELMMEIKAMIKERDNRGNSKNNCNFYNVGCMMPWMGYTPRTLDEIIEGASNNGC